MSTVTRAARLLLAVVSTLLALSVVMAVRPTPSPAAASTMPRFVIATEAASGAGDHIVLGLRDHGLEETAAKVGGRTLLSDPEWQSTLVRSIGDPSTRFTVSLDGLSGSSTYSRVMRAVQNGATRSATPTNWELTQLYQAGRLGDVTFVSGGSVVINPWAS